jgi:hypothetical protein
MAAERRRADISHWPLHPPALGDNPELKAFLARYPGSRGIRNRHVDRTDPPAREDGDASSRAGFTDAPRSGLLRPTAGQAYRCGLSGISDGERSSPHQLTSTQTREARVIVGFIGTLFLVILVIVVLALIGAVTVVKKVL